MSSSHRDLDRALDLELAFDLRKIHVLPAPGQEPLGGIAGHGQQLLLLAEELVGLAEVSNAVNIDAFDN